MASLEVKSKGLKRKGGPDSVSTGNRLKKYKKESKVPPVKAEAGGKRRKKWRGKKKGKKSSSGAPSVARLPGAADEYSSNWKRMMADIAPPKPTSDKTLEERAPKYQQFKRKRDAKKVIEEKEKKAAPDIWFDDVDEMLLDPDDRQALEESRGKKRGPTGEKESGDSLVKEKGFKGVTKLLAMDCEMVGVGRDGSESILARASIVNHFGHCIYDKFVKPTEKVTDYRTSISGIRPQDIENGHPFKEVQKEISDLLDGRVLVGHALKHDLKVLFLTHPKRMIRDTSAYKPFRAAFGGRTPSLKNLTARMVGVSVQEGEHSSVQDAQAAMRLYTMFRKEWEKGEDDRRQRGKSLAKAGLKTGGAKKDKSKAGAAEARYSPKVPVVFASSSSVGSGGGGKKRALYQDSDDEEC